MTKRMTLALLLTSIVCLVASESSSAPPTIVGLASLPTRGALSETDKKVVGEYVKYWVDKLCVATDQKLIDEAVGKLRAGYRANPSLDFPIEYARAIGSQSPKALTLKDHPLRRIKEINIAIVAAGMDQYTILDMLVIMSTHGNPGVRYWAAKGFRMTGRRLLIQDGRYARDMVSALEKMGLTETAMPVVSEIIVALGPHALQSRGARDCAASLAKVWRLRCGQVLARKRGVAEALARSARVTRRVRTMVASASPAAARKSSLQMLADAMEAASIAIASGKGDEKSAKFKGLCRLLTVLEIEARLAFGANEKAIATVLAGKEPLAERRLDVRLAYNRVWKPKFQAEGVTAKVKAPAPKPVKPPG